LQNQLSVLLNRLRQAVLLTRMQDEDALEDKNPQIEIQQQLEIHLYHQESTLLTLPDK